MTKEQIISRYGQKFFARLSAKHEPYYDYDRRKHYWQFWQIESVEGN